MLLHLLKLIKGLLLFLFFLGLGNFNSLQAQTAAKPAELEEALLPWGPQEKLTYQIEWGIIRAAQANFEVFDHGDRFEFKLFLKSTGWVATLYPIHSWFWSFQQKTPWRSIEYGEWRDENARIYRERTRIDYTSGQGHREQWYRNEKTSFPVPQTLPLDDLISFVYSLRYGPWNPGEIRSFQIYENGKLKKGQITCQEKVEESRSGWPQQPLLHLHAQPTGEQAKKGSLELWLTDDERRLLLEARLQFKYGTFVIRLINAEKEKKGGLDI